MLWLPTQSITDSTRIGAAEPGSIFVIADDYFGAAERPAIDDVDFMTFGAERVDSGAWITGFHPQGLGQLVARRRPGHMAPARRFDGGLRVHIEVDQIVN